MPTETSVARILDLIAGNEFLSAAHSESPLSFDGGHHERPVEFHLDPFLAEIGVTDRLHWTPSAARNVQVESGWFYLS